MARVCLRLLLILTIAALNSAVGLADGSLIGRSDAAAMSMMPDCDGMPADPSPADMIDCNDPGCALHCAYHAVPLPGAALLPLPQIPEQVATGSPTFHAPPVPAGPFRPPRA